MKKPPSLSKPRPLAVTRDKTPVWCHHDELCDPAALTEYPENPNTHPEDQLQRIAKIIKANGWREAITISRLTNRITKGHGRRAAAILAKWRDVPVVYQDYATEEDERRDVVADTRAHEGGVIDDTRLAEMLAGIGDKEGAGFDAEEAAAESFRKPTKINKVTIKPPPSMTWVLVGIPTIRYGEISSALSALEKKAEFFNRVSNGNR